MSRRRRDHAPLGVALSLLGVALGVSIGLAVAAAPVVARASVGWLVAVAAALVVVRVVWERAGLTGRAVCYWLSLLLSGIAILFSPVFGLYTFLGYYEAFQLPGRLHRLAGTVGTALVISVAQIGGITSPIMNPVVYLLFVAANLVITGLMFVLGRDRERLYADLAASNAELVAARERSQELQEQLLAQAREAGIEDERSRLSREIHDTVAQDLVAIITQLDAAQHAPSAEERTHRLAVAEDAARGALAEARRAVHALASPRLDDNDLPLALDDFLGAWRAGTGIDAELRVIGRATAGTHDDDLLRAGQEALSNVSRHAAAGRVQVLLDYRDDAAVLEITDDGTGFDVDRTPPGHGLTGMRTRLERVGGSMTLTSRPGHGTTVVARVPTRTDRSPA